MAPRSLVAGNWKMNGVKSSVSELEALIQMVNDGDKADCDVLICPPATLVDRFVGVADGSLVNIGAQDCHTNTSGAHTGDIAANMVADLGAGYIIVGHSERRADHGETSDLVNNKAEAVLTENLTAIICVGETEAERKAGDTLKVVVADQLANSVPESATPENTIIAYEPVWAIGTGLTPTVDDVAEVHTAIRAALVERFGDGVGNGFAILYGGSVKPTNAKELMAADNVNGALVGGASLKATDFNGIIDAYR
ncbi:triose-phosphate isomerase [Kordiimonas sp. SCSIO 12610]|uniref:triose-phosphate isomerase n=1 Tax=Kordiimonas sp. SCSIO 12610 TaxID=2829597 RepID=UPI00210969FC|nr:triose-phosphate isomerase [Kordiimonas sp. SCSIO 12610]UTW54033.1 triose-phosphate isomerase [Kordiimonas sp. SCSIO 12610]